MADLDRARHRRLCVGCLSAARVGLAALFWWLYARDATLWALVTVALAVVTDVLDGRLDRAWHLGSSGYLDAVADMLFVSVAFCLFQARGLYPWWVLTLVGAMFLQFVLTSGPGGPVYDPVGKYLGVYLYAAVAATVCWCGPVARNTVMATLVALCAAALASRAHLLAARRGRPPGSDAPSVRV